MESQDNLKYIEVSKIIDFANNEMVSAFYYPQTSQEDRKIEEKFYREKWKFVKEILLAIPAADVTEVVRCKDCYMYRKDTEIAEANNLNPDIYCALHQTEMPENGYCNYGRKKNNEIIHCSECKHLMQDGRCFEFADDNIQLSKNDYCSHAEKR